MSTRTSQPARCADSFAGQHSNNVEVFWHDKAMPGWNDWPHGGAGWYWWPCSPGCLPDGDPAGPFNSSGEAYRDATESD